MSRRELGLALSSLVAAPAAAACSDDDGEDPAQDSDGNGDAGSTEAVRVAVIGAGLAGTHAAYRLGQAGVDVTLYEASDRVGGRTFTGRELFEQDQICELGGELIDSNHRFMLGLVEELSLELIDRFAGDYADVQRDTWFVDGVSVPEEEITRQFTEVVDAFAEAVEAADSDDAEFERLDGTNLADWLDEVVPSDTYPELRAVLGAAYLGEFGLEIEQQSALNLIYLIGSDDPDPFRIFGESDERYQVRGGNDQIATRLAEELEGTLELRHVLTRARTVGNRIELTFDTPDGAQTRECDHLVFALPFTTLRRVDLADLDLSDDKLTMIDELGYGTNAKVMGAFTSRVWLDQGASGSLTSDLPLQQTWDSSVGQAGTQGILTNFLGGEQGMASGEGTADAWVRGVLPDLERVFPGAEAAYVPDSAVRMHWPTHAHTRGSYACYRPGQWAFWGTEGLAEGKVHFAGEHTSPEFQGWMEGAAETGGRVAIEILKELGLAIPRALEQLVDDDTALPGQSLLSVRFPQRLLRVRARQALAGAGSE